MRYTDEWKNEPKMNTVTQLTVQLGFDCVFYVDSYWFRCDDNVHSWGFESRLNMRWLNESIRKRAFFSPSKSWHFFFLSSRFIKRVCVFVFLSFVSMENRFSIMFADRCSMYVVSTYKFINKIPLIYNNISPIMMIIYKDCWFAGFFFLLLLHLSHLDSFVVCIIYRLSLLLICH